MSKWDKLERDVYNEKNISILAAEKAIIEEKKLASLARERDFKKNRDTEKYNLGIQWFDNGLSLEDAPDELKNNDSFSIGYNVAKRRALALELQKGSKHR